MGYGDSASTASIMDELGYSLSLEDLFDVEKGLFEEENKSRDYLLDKSAYENADVGMPFDIPFVKMKCRSEA